MYVVQVDEEATKLHIQPEGDDNNIQVTILPTHVNLKAAGDLVPETPFDITCANILT